MVGTTKLDDQALLWNSAVARGVQVASEAARRPGRNEFGWSAPDAEEHRDSRRWLNVTDDLLSETSPVDPDQWKHSHEGIKITTWVFRHTDVLCPRVVSSEYWPAAGRRHGRAEFDPNEHCHTPGERRPISSKGPLYSSYESSGLFAHG
jgi:hypothetical protein